MFKRMFSKSVIENKIKSPLSDLINSDYGLMYKTITSLALVKLMIEQEFKPVSLELIRINLEHIKDQASDIANFDVTEYLDEMNDVIAMDDEHEMELSIDVMINFNSMLKKGYQHIIFGGKMGLKMNTLSTNNVG